MRQSLILSTALGMAVLLGAPAFGQSSQGMSSSMAPLPQQQQAARGVETGSSQREVTNLLRQSEQAVSSGNWSRANEYLERAQTTMLNAHATEGGQGTVGLPNYEEARQAMTSRNRGEARQALQAAMSNTAAVGNMPGHTTTGAGVGAMPMQGGGMRGRYTPAQAQPQGGLGTPGGASPYGAQGGTETMPNRVVPGTSALGNVEGRPVAPRGAPPPGQPFPQAGGSSSNLSTGGEIKPGSPTLGGGTGGGNR